MKASSCLTLVLLVFSAIAGICGEPEDSAGTLAPLSRPWVLQAEAPALSGAGVSKVFGNAAESMMHDFYLAQGWSRLPGEVGTHGIDGLYVKYVKGDIRQVLISESKFGTSRLAPRQMTKEWVLDKLDELISRRARETPPDEALIAKYRNIKRMVSQGAGVRRTLVHTDIKGGKLLVRFSDLVEENGILKTTARRARGGGSGTSVFEIDLANLPSRGPSREAFDSWIKALKEELQHKGVPESVATRRVTQLEADLKSGKLSDRKALRTRMEQIKTVTPGQLYKAALQRWAIVGLGDMVITTGSLWLQDELVSRIVLREYVSIGTSVLAASTVEFVIIQMTNATGPAGWMAGGTYIITRIAVVEAWSAAERAQLAEQERLCQEAEARSRWHRYMTMLETIDGNLEESHMVSAR